MTNIYRVAKDLNDHIDKMQDVIRAYLPPDGISAEQALSDLIYLLDGPEQRAIQYSYKIAMEND